MRDRRTPFQFMRRQGLNTAGGDGPPTWGGVIGVLSDQTDLQLALNNKVNVGDDPYPQVVNHAALPSAAAYTGEIYIVQTTTGLIGLRKLAGLWRSDGATWTYLGLYGRNASEITNVPGVGSSATDVQTAIDEIGGRSTDGWAEGVSNLYFTAARVLGSALTGFSTASSVAVTATDTILSALGKLQAQIASLTTTVSGKLNASAVSAFGLALVDDADATAARATLALGNVNNTSDVNKPISNATQVALDGKAATAHNQTASTITDLAEAVQDIVGAMLVQGANVTIVYDDTTGSSTISASGVGGGGGLSQPQVLTRGLGC